MSIRIGALRRRKLQSLHTGDKEYKVKLPTDNRD